MFNRLKLAACIAVLVLGTSLFAGTEANSPTGSNGKRRFFADDRVRATMPDHPVDLAQPIQIPLYLTDANVVSVEVYQGNKKENFANQSSGSVIGSGAAKIVLDEGLTKIIEFTPLQVGIVDVAIVVFFSDGGMGHKSYQMHVVPSSNGLRRFTLNHGGHTMALVLEDKDEDSRTWLSPEVYYDHLDDPIYLTDFTQIKFTVQQSDGYPVIRLDSYGMLHALRPGKATIIADFDGVEDSVVVTVYTKENAPTGYRKILRKPVR